MGFVEDGKVEGERGLARRGGEHGRALVSGEDDDQAGMIAERGEGGGELSRLSGGQAEFVDVGDEFGFLGFGDIGVAADAEPVGGLAAGERLAHPRLKRLADECDAGDRDEDPTGGELLRDPAGGETLAGAAGTDEFAAGRGALDVVLMGRRNGAKLVRLRRARGRGRGGRGGGERLTQGGEEAGVERSPDFAREIAEPRQIGEQPGQARGGRADEGEGDVAADREGERRKRRELAMRERGIGVGAVFRLDGPEFPGARAREEIDALIAEREIEACTELGRDFVVEPDVSELGAICGRRAEVVADHKLKGRATFERTGRRSPCAKISPRGEAGEKRAQVHSSWGERSSS